jgi:hypothetical protein
MFLGGCGEKLQERILTVPFYPQETDLWCWAASSEMMMEYYLQRHVSQCTQANDYLNFQHEPHPDCCSEGPPNACIIPGGLTFAMYNYWFDKGHLGWEDIKAKLNMRQPFASVWTFDTDDRKFRHYTVAFGYLELGQDKVVLLHDPLYADHWIYSFGAFESGPGYRRGEDVYNLRLP